MPWEGKEHHWEGTSLDGRWKVQEEGIGCPAGSAPSEVEKFARPVEFEKVDRLLGAAAGRAAWPGEVYKVD